MKLVARRRELLAERANGSELRRVVPLLAKKYRCSPRSIYRDWRTRNTWIDRVLEIEDPRTFTSQLIAVHQEVQRRAWKIHLSADNDNARVGALNLVRKVNMDLMEMVSVPHLIRKLEALEGGAAVKLHTYRSRDICAELERRARNGEHVMRWCYLAGRKLMFRGHGHGYYGDQRCSGVREGSQRWLALRNTVSTRDLMREIQRRIVNNNYEAFNLFEEARLGTITVSWR